MHQTGPVVALRPCRAAGRTVQAGLPSAPVSSGVGEGGDRAGRAGIALGEAAAMSGRGWGGQSASPAASAPGRRGAPVSGGEGQGAGRAITCVAH